MKALCKNQPARFLDRESLRRLYVEEGLTQKEIARRYKRAQTTVSSALHAYGIEAGMARGERHGMWKGGVTISSGGYRWIRCPDHPHRNQGNYVQEHRLVMERVLGRYLRPEEVVHHIDDDRLNNAPENLQVFENNSKHIAETLKGKAPLRTEDGRMRWLQGCRVGATIAAANRRALKAYAQAHSTTTAHLRATLTPAALVLLKTELAQGRFECPPSSLIERASAGQLVPTAQS